MGSSRKFYQSLDKEEVVKSWKLSTSGDKYSNYLKHSFTPQDREYFHNMAHISAKTDWILMKFHHRCIFGQWGPISALSGTVQKSSYLLTYYILEVIRIRTLDPDPDWVRLGRNRHSPGALVSNCKRNYTIQLSLQLVAANNDHTLQP